MIQWFLPQGFYWTQAEAATSSKWESDFGKWCSNSLTSCVRITGTLVHIQASEVHSRLISRKWCPGVCILTNDSGKCLCTPKFENHSLKGEETSSGFLIPAQMNTDSPCSVTRVGEEEYWGCFLLSWEWWRNENSCCRKSTSASTKPEQFLEL